MFVVVLLPVSLCVAMLLRVLSYCNHVLSAFVVAAILNMGI
jgi:hypothetical protein